MIILTVPYKTASNILSIVPKGADFIEYRLDYCPDYSIINWESFQENTILTFRDVAEGGKHQISPEVKCTLIKQALAASNALIDCEYRFLNNHTELHIPPPRLILSLHTSIDKLQVIKEFITTELPAAYYKLAVACHDIGQLETIIELVKREKPDNFILIPTFPCSISARLVYKLYNSCTTYVHNDKPVISNQPNLDLINKCRIESINSDTQIFAIIGKEQILASLSLTVYNEWFRQTNTNRVFLPIVAESADEAIGLINWINKRAKVIGVAVTMPFKLSITPLIDHTRLTINSWLPASNAYSNTDAVAMKQAIEQLKLSKTDSILIYGKGATAQTAVQVLEQMGYHNVHQTYRNQAVSNTIYDLLINCTPFGLDEHDNPKELPEFNKLIDLPYGNQETSLVIKAREHKLDYIDGFTFWKWQAKAQAEFFGLEKGFGEFIDSLVTLSLVEM